MKKLTLLAVVTLVSLLVFAFAGCGTTKVSPAGLSVHLMKGDPPVSCKEVGSVNGKAGMAFGASNRIDTAKADMREKAAKMGANFVRLETVASDASVVTGTAFKCSPGALQ